MDGDKQPKATMSSVDRALSLLRHFTLADPEHGLSALARTAGMDKATTLRCLAALERNGFVEQDSDTKRYRLGVAPLQLAHVRERSVPFQMAVQSILNDIAHVTHETAHASLFMRDHLVTVAVAEPARTTRAVIDPSERLPLHATASGYAVLAAMPDDELAAALPQVLKRYAEFTPVTREEVMENVARVRARGVALAMGTYETDVVGTAIAILTPQGRPMGALAVAAVGSRCTDATLAEIAQTLTHSAQLLRSRLAGRQGALLAGSVRARD